MCDTGSFVGAQTSSCGALGLAAAVYVGSQFLDQDQLVSPALQNGFLTLDHQGNLSFSVSKRVQLRIRDLGELIQIIQGWEPESRFVTWSSWLSRKQRLIPTSCYLNKRRFITCSQKDRNVTKETLRAWAPDEVPAAPSKCRLESDLVGIAPEWDFHTKLAVTVSFFQGVCGRLSDGPNMHSPISRTSECVSLSGKGAFTEVVAAVTLSQGRH